MKRAIVTGGTRGIGKAVVERLLDEGYFVYFTYANSADEAQSMQQHFQNKCCGYKVNNADFKAINRFIQTVCSEGPIEALINNAGVSDSDLIENTTWERMWNIMTINLGGVYHYSTNMVRYMRKNRYGNIVTISSQASKNIRIGNALYGTSKAAIERFSESLAMEVSRFNIAVNMISPSFVETEMTAEILSDKRREITRNLPSRRLTQVEDIADTVMILLNRKPILFGTNIAVGGK